MAYYISLSLKLKGALHNCRIIRQKLEYICPKEVVNVATENGMGLAETLPEHIYLLKNKNNSNSSWPTLVLCIFITQT